MNHIDIMRDEIQQQHPPIHIVDFDFYNVEAFNQCENGKNILIAMDMWKNVHPLLKIIPVEWEYTIPFGILHSPTPSEKVKHFLDALRLAIKTEA